MLRIADCDFHSRLLIGSGKYSSADAMQKSLAVTSTDPMAASIRESGKKLMEFSIVPRTEGLLRKRFPSHHPSARAADQSPRTVAAEFC